MLSSPFVRHGNHRVYYRRRLWSTSPIVTPLLEMGDKGFTASELESRDNRNVSVSNLSLQDSTVREDHT